MRLTQPKAKRPMFVAALLSFWFVSPETKAQEVRVTGVLDYKLPIGAGREEQAIAAIKRLGGEVFRPVLIRDGRVVSAPKGHQPRRSLYIVLRGSRFTDNDLSLLEGLEDLGTLKLTGTRITDAGIADLRQWFPRVQIDRR